MYYETFQSFI
jgi:hypothetical protein